jgi:protein-tyrosine phosphatase
MGNICRSPLAQCVFETRLKERDMQDRVTVDSCGVAAFAVGHPPDKRAVEAGLRNGYDVRGQVARKIQLADFDKFHYIVAMDNINLLHVRTLAPPDFAGEIDLFRRYSQRGGDMQIADPYHKNAQVFDALIPQLEVAALGLLDHVSARLQ